MNMFKKLARILLLTAAAAALLTAGAGAAESRQAIAVGATTGSSLRMRS